MSGKVTLTAKHRHGAKVLTGVLFDEADFFDAKRRDLRIAEWWARGGTSAELIGIRLEMLKEKMERDLCPALDRLSGMLQCAPPAKLNRHQRRAEAAKQRRLGGHWHVYRPKA